LGAIDELELVDVTSPELLERLRDQAVLRPADMALAL
jgi:K+-sensing histidine kinase KdpD